MEDALYHQNKRSELGRKLTIAALVFALVVIVIGFIVFIYILSLNRPTNDFPLYQSFEIPDGATASDTAVYLEKSSLIRSAPYLKFILKTQFEDKFIQAGKYIFDKPLDTNEIARAITTGEYANPSAKLTVIEGSRGGDIVKSIHLALPHSRESFDHEAFDEHIGYLFPDTYFISPDITEEELIKLMRDTFDKKTAYLDDAFASSTLTKDEIVTLASIIEREANTEESMKIVSGILQDRLEIGMALQVDAAFEYLFGKESDELTDEDLTIDSPYNTYEYPGLPPTPIANPGLKAIEAALFPTETEYLYYLTGADGEFYYATTFDEHKLNKELYLR